MSVGLSIALIAIGAIMRYALNFDVTGVENHTVGLILMIVGGIGLAISLILGLVGGISERLPR